MKSYVKTVVLLSVVFLQSCTTTKTFWVNSYKTECSGGAGKMQCLLTSNDEDVQNATWENFYAPIEGFEFKPGYFQKIKVEVTELNKDEIPADGSSLKYKLIDVVDEVKDNRLKLNDIWVAQKINGAPLDTGGKMPQLEINISKMQILGHDGCNNYHSDIKKFTDTDFVIGNIASTRKMCANMSAVNAFNQALNNTVNYSVKGLNLLFFDKEGNELLVLKKVD